MTLHLASLGQIAMTVRDVQRASAFYKDQLGLPFLFSAPPNLAFFDLDGIRLMLAEPEAGESLGNSTLYFKVEAIQTVYQELQGRGISFEEGPHVIATLGQTELWMAFFRDPDGNLLALMSEVPVPG